MHIATAQSPDDGFLAEAVAAAGTDDAVSTVCVIDDDISVRESLDLLIRSSGWQSEGFGSAEEFLCRPRGCAPCCVVLDLTLPGLSGLELQKQLAGRPDLPIIVITGHTDVPTTVQAMKAGAVEFLTKPIRTELLVEAMREAIDLSRTALRLGSEMRALRNGYESLTRREREVMRLVASGLLNKQAGFELGISEITVKAHRGQVMRKMGAESLPDLVRMAARLGLHAGARH
jgi:FixJ family two-component response regulator